MNHRFIKKLTAIMLAVFMLTVLMPTNIDFPGIKTASAAGVTTFDPRTCGIGEKFVMHVTGDSIAGGGTFSSTNSSVASVTASGVVTCKAIGKTYITFTGSNGKISRIYVTVKKAPTAVYFSGSAIRRGVGETATITPRFLSGEYGGITWKSSDTSIARVDNHGKITMVSKGVCKVTATTYNGLSASFAITVNNAPAKLNMDKSSVTLTEGECTTLRVYYDTGASGVYTFASTNDTVAALTQTGKTSIVISAISAGTCTVNVKTYNGLAQSCNVTVLPKEKLTTTDNGRVCGVGEKFTMGVKSNVSSKPNGVYVSTNPAVASISASSGAVTCKASGTAMLKFISNTNMIVSAKITVKAAPSSIIISPSSRTMGIGEKYTMKAQLNSGAGGNVTWASSNKAVATVTQKGVVTALSSGTATITATTYNGKKSSSVVTVKAAPTKITLTPAAVTIAQGETQNIKVAYQAGQSGAYTYSSSDIGVATVAWTAAATLKITAVNPGTATITVKAYNGVKAYCNVTVTAKATYHSWFIGNSYSGDNQLNGTIKDANNMINMMAAFTKTPYIRYGYITTDMTGYDFIDTLDNLVLDAEENDITLFYYSGHGADDGSLVTNDYYAITPSYLRQCLDQIEGKKVVILDCCHSGKMIGKGIKSASSQQQFASAFISGFFGNKAKGTNNLADSDYYVLTACNGSQLSVDTYYGGLFTSSLLQGCGYNNVTQSYYSTLYADSNGDNKITMRELYSYLTSNYNGRTEFSDGSTTTYNVCAYPQYSDFVLFAK